MPVEFKTYIPKVKILNKTILGNDYNIGEFARRISGNSSLDQPANTIVLELVPSESTNTPGYTGVNSVPYWLKTIDKGDLISVGIETEHSYLYRIDGVYERKVVTQNGAESGVRIMGRSLVSVLLDDDITFAPELSQSPRAIKLLGALRATFLGFLGGLRGLNQAGISQFLDGNPMAAVLWIFLNMPSVNAKIFYVDYDDKGMALSGSPDKVGKLFDFDFKMYEKDLLYNQELNQYTGKVWNYIQQCLDPMFYELFEETRIVNGKLRPTIFIRPKPFDRTTDRKEVIESRILRLVVERDGDINKGDFNVTLHPIAVGEQTVNVFDIGVKGFNTNDDSYDFNIERVNLFWDNENTPAGSDNNIAFIPLSGDQTTVVKPPTGNSFVTCVTKELFHTVPETEDYEKDLGSTTRDIVNFITMHALKDEGEKSELAQLGFFFPLIDAHSVLQWGIRKMEAHTLMMHVQSAEWTDEYSKDLNSKPINGGKVYPLEAAVKLRERIFSWYRYNPLFLSGRVRVLGHDYYRKGDKIYFPHHLSHKGHAGGMYYYIQGVNWVWDVNQGSESYITYLDLSRGENKEQLEEYRLLAGYDLYDKDILQDGDRENPVIKIDVVLAELGENAGQKETDKNKNNKPVVSTEIDEDEPENPNRNDIAFQQGLTQYASDTFKDKLGAEALKTLIETAATHGINPNVMVGLIDAESSFNPNNTSGTDCLGLGQFCRRTARKMDAFADEVGTIKEGNPPNDVRRNPIKSIKAVGELLYKNGYSKNPVLAIMCYGNNDETTYFGYVANTIEKYQTGVFDSKDKAWASRNYYTIATGAPKPKPKAKKKKKTN